MAYLGSYMHAFRWRQATAERRTSRISCVGACRLRAKDTPGMSSVRRRMLLMTPTVDTVK